MCGGVLHTFSMWLQVPSLKRETDTLTAPVLGVTSLTAFPARSAESCLHPPGLPDDPGPSPPPRGENLGLLLGSASHSVSFGAGHRLRGSRPTVYKPSGFPRGPQPQVDVEGQSQTQCGRPEFKQPLTQLSGGTV